MVATVSKTAHNIRAVFFALKLFYFDMFLKITQHDIESGILTQNSQYKTSWWVSTSQENLSHMRFIINKKILISLIS